ncbi:hypothetical protein Trydic_g16633 [Trypoxylus dichotomus]
MARSEISRLAEEYSKSEISQEVSGWTQVYFYSGPTNREENPVGKRALGKPRMQRREYCSALIAIYVNDILIFSKDTKTVEGIARTLSNESELNDSGDAQQLFSMTDCKPAPLNPNNRLMKSTLEPTEEESKQPYRELVGALTYLSLCTRSDTSFARLATDRCSYTGHRFILSGAAISWESKKQQTVALSTTKAEYMGLIEVAKEAIYLRSFLIELGVERLPDVKVYNNNLSALRLAKNPTYHARNKHIDIRHHFVRDVLKSGQLELLHVGTNDMIADVLTKGLPRTKHEKCVESLGLTGL